MKQEEQEKLIDAQIDKFENEILILQGCISTLKVQKIKLL